MVIFLESSKSLILEYVQVKNNQISRFFEVLVLRTSNSFDLTRFEFGINPSIEIAI